MEPGQSPDSPQLVGVVIITLPPADDPSLGKTITAFTLSDSPSPPPPPQQPQLHHPPPDPPVPDHFPPNIEPPFLLRRAPFLFGSPRVLFGFLGISLIALILWACPSSNPLFELRSSKDENDRKPSSFVFPLFPKSGVREMSQREIELKLGRIVRRDSQNLVAWIDDGLKYNKNSKTVSTASNLDSNAILPVRGNIYPDGLFYSMTYLDAQ